MSHNDPHSPFNSLCMFTSQYFCSFSLNFYVLKFSFLTGIRLYFQISALFYCIIMFVFSWRTCGMLLLNEVQHFLIVLIQKNSL